MKRKKFEILILLLIVVIAVAAGCKKQEPVNDTAPVATITAVDTTPTGGTVATATIALTAPDKQFILDAATAILAETAYSKTADALSPDVAVKALGHLMINHFADMLAELTALGQKHDVLLPTEIEIKVVAANDALAKMKGKEFDRTFLQHIIDDTSRCSCSSTPSRRSSPMPICEPGWTRIVRHCKAISTRRRS